jgi:hypothetical protein
MMEFLFPKYISHRASTAENEPVIEESLFHFWKLRRFFSFPQRPYRLWPTPILLWCYLPGDKQIKASKKSFVSIKLRRLRKV